MSELKTWEKALFVWSQKGYYWCKVFHKKLYADITNAYASFITRPMLVMIHHKFTTQKNEALNNIIFAYA